MASRNTRFSLNNVCIRLSKRHFCARKFVKTEETLRQQEDCFSVNRSNQLTADMCTDYRMMYMMPYHFMHFSQNKP